MKHIRNILLLITIIFAFVMQAEVYQNMLWNFNGAYYLSSRYTTTNDDMDSFLANAEDTAEKHGVIFFRLLIREFLIIRQDFIFMVMIPLFGIVLKARWVLRKKHIRL